MEKLNIFLCIMFTGSLAGTSHAADTITIAAKLNGDVRLPCRLPTEDSDGVTVRWFNEKDGWLTSGTRVYKHHSQLSVVKPAPNEWILVISRVSRSFEDVYTCRKENGDLISSVKLIIETSPKIDEQQSSPIKVTVTETSTAILTCVVTGTPEPEIAWHRGKHSMKEIKGITGPELKILNTSRYAADEYMCRASNKNGHAERRMMLTVNFDPEVTVFEPEVYAAGGEVAVMSCVVQASPLHDAYWTIGTDVNGERLRTNWKFTVMEEEAGDDIPVRFLTLIIGKAIIVHRDYGMYTCVARGENLVAKDTVELKERKAVSTEENAEKVINYN